MGLNKPERAVDKAARRLMSAQSNEAEKAIELRSAACRAAREGRKADDVLFAAAKAWTNAYYQRSRCEKHLREAIKGKA